VKSADDVLIRTEGLTKRYGRLTALEGCSLDAAPGEVLGLLGPNGAGKTTLLRLLLGFIQPTSGRATIDRLDCYRQSVDVHRRLTYLPGDPRLFRQLDGRATLRLFASMRRETSLEVAMQLAERLQLDTSRTVRQMSTGMRQKLALVVALAPDVPLIVLDEPTSNLDPTIRSDVLQMLREARDEGKTVLFSSHVLSEVEEVCDRVVALRGGRVVESLRMAEVRRQHCIRAKLTGPLVLPEGSLGNQLEVDQSVAGWITIFTGGPLEPLLGWLAQQPLAELQIEPVGLKAIYQRHDVNDETPDTEAGSDP